MAKRVPENRQKTGNSTSFRPGQSGNPGGRPKLTSQAIELRDLARQHTEEALHAIVAVLGDKKAPASARVGAASEILDRGWGRAPAPLQHSGPDGAPVPIALTPMDWDALLRRVTGVSEPAGDSAEGSEE